jgi:hypothetical protein
MSICAAAVVSVVLVVALHSILPAASCCLLKVTAARVPTALLCLQLLHCDLLPALKCTLACI